MTENVETLILEHLRAIRGDIGSLARKIDDLTLRVGAPDSAGAEHRGREGVVSPRPDSVSSGALPPAPGRTFRGSTSAGALEEHVSALRRDIALIHQDIAILHQRLDRNERRLERIERGLELSEHGQT